MKLKRKEDFFGSLMYVFFYIPFILIINSISKFSPIVRLDIIIPAFCVIELLFSTSVYLENNVFYFKKGFSKLSASKAHPVTFDDIRGYTLNNPFFHFVGWCLSYKNITFHFKDRKPITFSVKNNREIILRLKENGIKELNDYKLRTSGKIDEIIILLMSIIATVILFITQKELESGTSYKITAICSIFWILHFLWALIITRKKTILIPAILSCLFVFGGITSCSQEQTTYKNTRNYSYDLTNTKEYLTQQEFDEDLDALEHLLSHTYVLYDKSVKKGFKMNAFLNSIKAKCPKSFNDLYSSSNLLKSIKSAGFEHLPYKDSHLNLSWGYNYESVFSHHTVYLSNTYFEKIGKDYFVHSSDDENVKAGSKYKGKSENLYKCLTKSGELYRFGTMSDYAVELADLKLNTGTVTVKVSHEQKYYAYTDTSYAKTEENYLYIKISDWAFGENQDIEAMTNPRQMLAAIKETAKTAAEKDYVIIDLRGNPGGISYFAEELLYHIYFTNNPALIGPFTNNLKQANTGTINLISSEIAYAGTRHSQISKLYAKEYDPDYTAPEYKGLEAKPAKNFPAYTGEKTFNGKLIILIDSYSASASEMCIATARLIDKDNVILVGENSAGCISYGGVYPYYLPNSGICLNLSNTDFSETAMFVQNEKWAGETYGFMPDYWATNETLKETVDLIMGK